MDTYFNIQYEMDREKVHTSIAARIKNSGSDYICVADGVILNTANRIPEYNKVVNGGMFSICDSSYVPLYLKWIYGRKYQQYCGSEIFEDIVRSRKYRMIFLGTQQPILDGLKENLIKMNSEVQQMKFIELPFMNVSEFDYPDIAKMVKEDGAEIIWVALGAPKQEYFMHYLQTHLNHGVMIGVGAAFKFFSGVETNRAPEWMVKNHLEFIHRILKEPQKQAKRCYHIIKSLPTLLYKEWKVKYQRQVNEE